MRVIACLYILSAACVVLCADVGQYVPGVFELHAVPLGDKLLHFLFSGGLGLVLNCAALSSKRWPAWQSVMIGTLTAAALCTAEEASNMLTPLRDVELMDLAANYLGITLIGAAPVAAYLMLRRRLTPIHTA